MPLCVVVDGYSKGQGYPSYFHKMGYLCIHIETDQSGSVFSSFNPEEYEIMLQYDGNWEELTKILDQYRIACVVPGSDPGVELAETLNFVTTVSLDSRHYIQSVMVIEKRETPEGRLIFEAYSLVGSNNQAINQYARDVLDALGVRNGAAHLGIVETENGPVLLESIAGRMDTVSQMP